MHDRTTFLLHTPVRDEDVCQPLAVALGNALVDDRRHEQQRRAGCQRGNPDPTATGKEGYEGAVHLGN